MMSAPLARTSSGRTALTVAAVPTGMKAGVLSAPRCMAMTPDRAAPSVAAIEKEKRVTAGGPSGAMGGPLGPDGDRPVALSAPDGSRDGGRLRRCDCRRRWPDHHAGTAVGGH